MVAYLKSILSFLSTFFSLREKNKEDKKSELEKSFEVIMALVESQREERQFFREWLTGFQTAPPTKATTIDDEIIESIENEARLGNTFAQDLIANEDRLKDYIKLTRDTY